MQLQWLPVPGAQAIADGYHVDAVPVAATHTNQNRLPGGCTDVQPIYSTSLLDNQQQKLTPESVNSSHCLGAFTLKGANRSP